MTTIALRTSERTLFKRCQWQWKQSYINKLSPIRQESTALWFGTGIHLALEKYYIKGEKRGEDPVKTWEQYCDDTVANTTYINTDMGGDSSVAVEAKELGSAMLREYVKEYGNEAWMDVLATELEFQVGIKYNEHLKKDKNIVIEDGVAYYVGTMDLVFRDLRDNKIYVMDHKTARALGSSNTQYLPLDDQAGAYYAVALTVLREKGLIGKKESISGIVYNYLVKSMPDDRPKNKDGLATNKPKKEHFVAALLKHDKEADEAALKKLTVAKLEAQAEEAGLTVLGEVSKQQPPKKFDRVIVRKNLKQQRKQIFRMADDLTAMSLVRNGIAKETKNPTRDCTFCPFQEICEADEKAQDYSDLVEHLYTQWDPYEAHREVIDEG